jgi:predicted nucleic acid-binding protein
MPPARFVLDNSVAMRWLLRDGSDERLAYASKVLDLLERQAGEAVVPGIWALEAANVMLKAQAKGLVTEARVTAFIGLLKDMRILTDPSTADRALGDTLQLARRFKLSSYDAAYLELALRENLPLATLDTDLQDAMVRTGGALI